MLEFGHRPQCLLILWAQLGADAVSCAVERWAAEFDQRDVLSLWEEESRSGPPPAVCWSGNYWVPWPGAPGGVWEHRELAQMHINWWELGYFWWQHSKGFIAGQQKVVPKISRQKWFLFSERKSDICQIFVLGWCMQVWISDFICVLLFRWLGIRF